LAKFCDDDCKAVCDFCIHFKRDAMTTIVEDDFDGTCDVENFRTDASSGHDCDDFHCSLIES